MVRPEPQRPFEGLITIHCELSPMASTEHEPGRYVRHRTHIPFLSLNYFLLLCRQSEEEVALARMLDKIFRRSDAIDREALCIIAGERVSIPNPISTLSRLKPHPVHKTGLASPHRGPRPRRRRLTPRLRRPSLRRGHPALPPPGRRSPGRARSHRSRARFPRARPARAAPHALLRLLCVLPRLFRIGYLGAGGGGDGRATDTA